MEKSFNVNNKEYKRLFIGISLREEICNYFHDIALNLNAKNNEVKPVHQKNIHITLKFIGNVNKKIISKICKIISSSLDSKPSFKFDIGDSFDGFPSFTSSRILYGVVVKGIKEIEELYYLIEDNLSDIGIEKDVRKFIPHITIARMKKPVNLEDLTANIKLEKFDNNICDKIILYESILSRTGPEYIIEKEFLLGK